MFISNKNIGSNILVKRFLKGIFNKKPSLPRHTVTWNVSSVLSFLKTINNNLCSLQNLTKKVTMLLALTTGQRIQTLCAIDIRNMEICTKYVKIWFGDLLKQSRPDFHLQALYIESFPEDESLCVVKSLSVYLESTKLLRKDNVLFITTVKPYSAASRNTVANWLQETLKDSGIDMGIFSPHSTRAASTSAVVGKVPVNTILRTAGWRTDCTFRKHYNRPVMNDSSFSHQILSSL